MNEFTKTPAEVLDYKYDWTAELANVGGDTINTSTVTPDAGITVTTQSHNTNTATAWLSGGTLGQRYKVVNRIVTLAGRTYERTLYLQCDNSK